MKTGILTNGSTVKNHISLKTGFGYSATQRTSFRSCFLVCQRVLPQCPSSTSMTLSRQEIDHPKSSSTSSTSPTMTSSAVSSDSVFRGARSDLCGIEFCPGTVPSKPVERIERGDPLTKPKIQNPKKTKTTI